jgi:hypothetical protein
MVSRTAGHNPLGQLGFRQRGNLVVGPAELEGEDGLLVLALEVHLYRVGVSMW